jgi:hypothetical protein
MTVAKGNDVIAKDIAFFLLTYAYAYLVSLLITVFASQL